MEPQAALSEVRAGERKGRIRELLAEYYTEDAQGHGLAARQESTDPCDLDGAAFDVDLYMEESMQGERMKQLLKKTSTIRGEVKTLDNDMQMLVYENYTKFISATDTIGQMKEGVEGMEDEMQSLAATITKISDGSNRINTNLSEHRAKIDKLTGVRRLLTKLQFLMELPARLRQCVVEERFGDAIRYYEGTKGVLERFKTTEGFGNLEAQIEESMDEIRAQLQARLREPRGDEATVREARDLLLELGRSEDDCMEEMDAAARGLLADQLQKGRGAFKDPPADDLDQRVDLASLEPFSDELGGPFVHTWLRYVMLFDALFVQGQDDEELQAARRARLAGNARGPMERYFELVAAHLVPGAVAVEMSDASPSWSRTPRPPELAPLVFQLQGFGVTVAAVERALPGEGLLAAGGLALVRTVEGTAASCFATCRKCLVGVIAQIRRVCAAAPSIDTEDDQVQLVNVASGDLLRCTDDCLDELKCLVGVKGPGVPSGFDAKVVESVHAAVGDFIQVVGEDLCAMASEFASASDAELDGTHVDLDVAAALRSLCASALCGASMAQGRGLITAVAEALDEYFGAGSNPVLHGSTRGYSMQMQMEAMLKQRTACLQMFVIRGGAALLGPEDEEAEAEAVGAQGQHGEGEAGGEHGDTAAAAAAGGGGLGMAFGSGCPAFQSDTAPTAVRSTTIAAARAVAGFAGAVSRIYGDDDATSDDAAAAAAASPTASGEAVQGTATMRAMADVCAAAAEGDGAAASAAELVSAPSPPTEGVADTVVGATAAAADSSGEAQAALHAVLCAAAKAVVEMLRLTTLTECGYQQVMLDLSYIMVVFETRYGLQGDALSGCLNALFDAAAERCSAGATAAAAQPLGVAEASALIASALQSDHR